MNAQDIVLDLYPFLPKKNSTDSLGRVSVSYSWVPKDHLRRLNAYTILGAYLANQSNAVRRHQENEDMCEFGDANFVCTTLSMSLLGDKVGIVAPGEKGLEEFFAQWAEDEMLFSKMAANEHKASNLGDCVYRLNWSKSRQRTLVTTFDPGFWFPFNIGKSNERHILAWEEEDPKKEGDTIIYKEEYKMGSGKNKDSVTLTGGFYKKGTTASLDDLELIRYEQDEKGDIQDRPLGVNFFPIIYIPNIYREGNDFGESDLTGVYRILDELINTYTGEAGNADFMGETNVWVDSKTMLNLPVDENGYVKIKTGKNRIIPGQAGVIDNSTINDALMKYEDKLVKKLLKNSFIGDVGAGQAQTGSGDRTTGIMQLKGTPIERFIGVKRLMRYAKYNKMLKYVARFEQIFGSKASKQLFVEKRIKLARIQFGNILPIDGTALVTDVQKVIAQLDNEDIRDNLREAGLIVNKPIKDMPVPVAPANPVKKSTTPTTAKQ